jgi:hypothetical protein
MPFWPPSAHSRTWMRVLTVSSMNLAASFAGQTVQIHFLGTTDGSLRRCSGWTTSACWLNPGSGSGLRRAVHSLLRRCADQRLCRAGTGRQHTLGTAPATGRSVPVRQVVSGELFLANGAGQNVWVRFTPSARRATGGPRRCRLPPSKAAWVLSRGPRCHAPARSCTSTRNRTAQVAEAVNYSVAGPAAFQAIRCRRTSTGSRNFSLVRLRPGATLQAYARQPDVDRGGTSSLSILRAARRRQRAQAGQQRDRGRSSRATCPQWFGGTAWFDWAPRPPTAAPGTDIGSGTLSYSSQIDGLCRGKPIISA